MKKNPVRDLITDTNPHKQKKKKKENKAKKNKALKLKTFGDSKLYRLDCY
jgi:hypothetical protein